MHQQDKTRIERSLPALRSFLALALRQRGTICIATFVAVGLVCHVSSTFGADQAGIDFFESKIRPVLIKHCYECHSADSVAVKGGLLVDSAPALMQGGDSGPSLVKGKPAESMLLDALKFESFEMPPSGKLPDSVIADFEKWIAMGAPDPRTEFKAAKHSPAGMDIEAGRQFWAFQPPEAHDAPEVQNKSWPNNWIDNFVLSRLEQNQLAPSEETDRATLLRRIAYDLTGLPPKPADVEKILYSDDPDAVNRYISQLIDSPQFGEHWGRHWLDVARYADSNGGDFNATFHNAWRYRNYVVETFNQDRPFSEFVIEQIAGDLLDADNDEERTRNVVATGFLMFGTKMLSERDKEKLRMDVVDEQVSAIGQAFMGMTLGCARCHDHKFDPIPTTDYYAMAGILRGTQTLDGEIQKYVSNWTRQSLPMTPEHAQALAEYQTESGSLKKQIKSSEARLKKLEENSSRSNVLKQGILLDDSDAEVIGNWTSSTYSKNFIGKGYIHDDRQDRGQKKVIFRTRVSQAGEYEIRFAFPGSAGRATNVPVKITHGDMVKELVVDQSQQAPILTMLKPLGTYALSAEHDVVIEISNRDADGYVIVDAVQIVAQSELKQTSDENPTELAELETLKKEIQQLKAQLKKLDKHAPPPEPQALAVREAEQKGDYFVCIRGEHRNLGPKVRRGFLTVATYGEPPQIEDDQSGRVALAKWVADPRHPLTARVYVNRVWHHLMGAGLVRSVDNFGTLGEPPTHPLLLDQLAVKFVENNWSTKWLVREILKSRTYRMSSRYDDARWQEDPENRLLWRMNSKPLTAEAIRDTLLLSTQDLDFKQGGPPVANLGTLVTQNTSDDKGVKLDASFVRTLYQPVIRNELPSVMRVFDFADPDFVSGKRTHTTVPTQALWMLNGPLVGKQSQKLAEQLLQSDVSTTGERLEQLFLSILGRPPVPSEIEVAQQFLEREDLSPAETWTDLAHALFASASFRILD